MGLEIVIGTDHPVDALSWNQPHGHKPKHAQRDAVGFQQMAQPAGRCPARDQRTVLLQQPGVLLQLGHRPCQASQQRPLVLRQPCLSQTPRPKAAHDSLPASNASRSHSTVDGRKMRSPTRNRRSTLPQIPLFKCVRPLDL